MLASLATFTACLMLANAGIVKRQAAPCPDECENKPIDISLIVDNSASIWPKNFTIGLWFLQSFVDQFDIGADRVRVSMVTYGDRVYDEDAFGFEQFSEKQPLNLAIDETPYRSGRATETGMAIEWFLEHHRPQAREGVRSVVIVLTDGNSQNGERTKLAAERLHEHELDVFAIGVGHQVTLNELHNIATDGEHVFVVSDYNALEDIRSRLTYEACEVKPEPYCGFAPVDVSFVIDSSVSIGNDNFTLELNFIRNFLKVFSINPSSTRVSAVMFGHRVYDELAIQFDQFRDKKETLDAIMGLPYQQGRKTETGQGITYMIENSVPKFRSHAAHIAIIITDGKSQDWEFTREAAKRARDLGVTTVAVGVGKIGSSLDQDELDAIAGDRSRVVTADDFAQLNAVREALTEVTCEGVARAMSAPPQ